MSETPVDPHPKLSDTLTRLREASPEERANLVLALIKRDERLELPGSSAHRVVLADIDLSRETLQRRLDQQDLEYAPWWDDAYAGVELEEAELPYANFMRAKLQGADFAGANLHCANFSGADLRNARLESVKLTGQALLPDADLRAAWMKDASLKGAVLVGAKLQGANFWGADLEGARFTRVEMSAQPSAEGEEGLDPTSFMRANLKNAMIEAADMRGVDLFGADLQGASLFSSNLAGADLSEARLQGVDLSVCKSLSSIRIADAWLDRTRMRQDQLGGAIGEELDAANRTLGAKERAEKYSTARRGYLVLKQNFEDLGDYAAASWAYQRERLMEKRQAIYEGRVAFQEGRCCKVVERNAKVGLDSLAEWTTGYGESIRRVLISLFVVWFLFALGFGLFHAVERAQDGPAGQTWQVSTEFADWALFSLGSMTTLQAQGLQAACRLAEFFQNLETLLAIALTGLLGFVIGNRIRRS